MSSYSTYLDYLKALGSSVLGRLWLAKFRYDLKHGNLPPGTEVTLERLVEDKLRTLPPTPLRDPLSIIKAVIDENPKLFDLQGRRSPPTHEPYSLVLKVDVLASYYLRRRAILTLLDEGEDEFDFVWDNLGSVITPDFFDGEVKTERDFFWCAPTRAIEDAAAGLPPDEAATAIRNRLGLLIERGHRLIRVDVPDTLPYAYRYLAPTTLDSGVYPAFIPCKEPDGYGRTLNLEHTARDVKELVGEKAPLDDTFKAHRIGRVLDSIPTIMWHHMEALVT